MLPDGLISEDGAEFVNSYTAISSGETQATISYISSKTTAQNAGYFNDIMIKNGWSVLNELKKEDKFVSTYEKKNTNQKIVVSINPYQNSKNFLIDISLMSSYVKN